MKSYFHDLEHLFLYLEDRNIVCPQSAPWFFLWELIFDGHNEPWKDKRLEGNCQPCVLGSWAADGEEKNRHFKTSIEYFYNKYPEKRLPIENFCLTNREWSYFIDPKLENVFNRLLGIDDE